METTKLQVPFSEFVQELYRALNEKLPRNKDIDLKCQCLKMTLAEKVSGAKEEIVVIEKFALFSKWFGPFRRHDNRTMLDAMLEIASYPWFHGNIDKDEAKEILTTFKPINRKGKALSYLVRVSTSDPVDLNPFTISKWTKENKIVHQRIQYNPSTTEYSLAIKEKGESMVVSSGPMLGLPGLILAISEKGIVGEPAPRRKYQALFVKQTEDLGYLLDNN